MCRSRRKLTDTSILAALRRLGYKTELRSDSGMSRSRCVSADGGRLHSLRLWSLNCSRVVRPELRLVRSSNLAYGLGTLD